MKILGIDPGIATTGYGVIQQSGHQHQALAYGAIITKPHIPLPQRLHELHSNLCSIITKHRPQAMAVEELFFNNNAKTALIVGQARGVILLAGEQFQIPVTSYTPLQIKMAVCGYGRADKKQVQQMIKTLLNLSQIPKPDDVADALATAVCHSHSYKLKSLVK
jgi:crossover junction endodeoxyribonuclease RuvC